MISIDPVYPDLSDNELFNLIKEDDKKAFEVIYTRYWDFLTQSASKHLESKQKAEDVVQEIFISFYKRRNEIELSFSLRAYLCKALKFKMMNEFRSKEVREAHQKYVRYAYTYAYATNNFFNTCESKELVNNINHSINLLPSKCREAFLLSRSQELSYKDISGHLGISVSTVEKHISKALKFLKVNLNLQYNN